MKKLTTLEQILKVFRIPRTEDDPEIERLDRVIAEWDDVYMEHLTDAICREFGFSPGTRNKMRDKLLAWMDQDTYNYLRLKVGRGYFNEFGDTLTREKGYAVNIRAELVNLPTPGARAVKRFERLRDAKDWIDEERKRLTYWKLQN
jgi:hypothetical protein